MRRSFLTQIIWMPRWHRTIKKTGCIWTGGWLLCWKGEIGTPCGRVRSVSGEISLSQLSCLQIKAPFINYIWCVCEGGDAPFDWYFHLISAWQSHHRHCDRAEGQLHVKSIHELPFCLHPDGVPLSYLSEGRSHFQHILQYDSEALNTGHIGEDNIFILCCRYVSLPCLFINWGQVISVTAENVLSADKVVLTFLGEESRKIK